MQTSTLVLLACLVAMTCAMPSPALDAVNLEDLESVHETAHEIPEIERTHRDKRGLLLLKKKLLLGALAAKAAKVGVVGGAVAGAAIAHKSKPQTKFVSLPYNSYGHSSHGPSWNVEVHSWH